jgi:hypothetical protein
MTAKKEGTGAKQNTIPTLMTYKQNQQTIDKFKWINQIKTKQDKAFGWTETNEKIEAN